MASDLGFQITRMRSTPDNYLDAPNQAPPAELQIEADDKLKPIARITRKTKPEDSYITDDGRITAYKSITSGLKLSHRSLLGLFYGKFLK